jgi:hypothetical protein
MKELDGEFQAAIHVAVEIVNLGSLGPPVTADALRDSLDRHGYQAEPAPGMLSSSEIECATQTLEQVLRSDLDGISERVNEVLARLAVRSELQRDRVGRWYLRAVARDKNSLVQLVLDAVMGVGALVSAKELSRVSTCTDSHCSNITFDVSRNRSRRFCSAACSNRGAVAAYRARQTASG